MNTTENKPATPRSRKKAVTPVSIVKDILKAAFARKKKPQPIQIKQRDELVNVLSDDVGLINHIKDLAVRKIVELKTAQVEQSLKIQDDILAIIAETNGEINKLTGNSNDLNDGISWFSLDDMNHINFDKSQYAVPNQNFSEAEREFNAMLKAHNYSDKDPFVYLANAAFKLTKSNRVDIQALNRLIRCPYFDAGKFPEWNRVKTLLSNCYDWHERKMSLAVSTRESLKHRWELVTDR